MFIINLRFAQNKEKASAFMQEHNQWIKRGFDDKVFLMVGRCLNQHLWKNWVLSIGE